MIVGIPKEIKNNENRVGITPAGAMELIKNKHQVLVESKAGEGSGFTDDAYIKAGAMIINSAKEIYEMSDMIVKVKEPVAVEWPLIKEGQLLFTYFHFAAAPDLTQVMLQKGATCIAYETVETDSHNFPLLTPMSEVAGRMAVIEGAKYLEKTFGGKGKLLSGVPGVSPASVIILGAGIVGINAAKMAAGFGANVTIMDVNLQRLRYLEDVLPANVQTLYSNELNLLEILPTADLVIGAIMVPGGRTPILIKREHLQEMEPGTVLVDVAVDQGGCIETIKPTTHESPTYFIDNILHYGVANMPGAVPQTSTRALTNATLPYVIQLADLGWKGACKKNVELAKGLNIVDGKIVYKNLADSLNLEYTDVSHLLHEEVNINNAA